MLGGGQLGLGHEYVYLNTKDAKDDEKGTADEDNVANGLEGRDQGLDHQLQSWSSADHPVGQTGGEGWKDEERRKKKKRHTASFRSESKKKKNNVTAELLSKTLRSFQSLFFMLASQKLPIIYFVISRKQINLTRQLTKEN